MIYQLFKLSFLFLLCPTCLASSAESNNAFIKEENLVHSLENLKQLYLFTNDAHYNINNEIQDASESISSNIFYEDVGDEIILVSYFDDEQEHKDLTVNEDLDNIERVTLVNKSRGHVVETYISTEFGNEMKLLRSKKSEDHDYEELNKKFRVSGYDMENEGEEVGVGMRLFDISTGFSLRGARTEDNIDIPCTDFNEIELGIAFESTFCEEKGGEEKAVSDILNLMALVSLRFEQNDLCTKVRISHLEGYCDSDIDPYKDGVRLNKGGCSEDDYGAKDYFADYWQDNRSHVHRDAAMLFSGTPLECDSEGRCVVGCANTRSLCDKKRGYSVVDGSFAAGGDDNVRAVIVSHELGHMSGASHKNKPHNIMSPLLGDGSKGFDGDTIRSMQCHMRKSMCITDYDA